jgi:hypothetical protein
MEDIVLPGAKKMREMTIGARSFIDQAISRDNYPFDSWDTSKVRNNYSLSAAE